MAELESFYKAADQGFPYIQYDRKKTSREWGFSHGEQYKEAIQELAAIRKSLLLAKRLFKPEKFEELAQAQFQETKEFAPDIADEIQGIAEGSGVSLSDIVCLNNSAGFGDINIDKTDLKIKHKSGRFYEQSVGIKCPEESGVSVHFQDNGHAYVGSLLNAHGSLKKYLCVIDIPEDRDEDEDNYLPGALVLSMLGCVGISGFNTFRQGVSVSNIRVTNGQPGVIRPALVRKMLQQRSTDKVRETLLSAPVTGGAFFQLSSPKGSEIWEIAPGLSDKVSSLGENDYGSIFHTSRFNSEKLKSIEGESDAADFGDISIYNIPSSADSLNDLLANKTAAITDYQSLKGLLHNHDDFPRSVCYHFDNGAQDPAWTVGGFVADLESLNFRFWRGCPDNDDNFAVHEFQLMHNDSGFAREFIRDEYDHNERPKWYSPKHLFGTIKEAFTQA
jgi:isopenicillin-N N-acyltransferase like protein